MEQINLNLIPGRVLPVCHVSQYDVGRTIRVNLFEGDAVFALATGDTAEIHVRKPDDTVVSSALTVVNGQTYFDIVTTQQMDAAAGPNVCEIQLKRGGDTLGTLNFIMEVEPDPMDGGIASQSEIRDLQAQVDAAVVVAVTALQNDFYEVEAKANYIIDTNTEAPTNVATSALFTKKAGYNSLPYSSGGVNAVRIQSNASYDSYLVEITETRGLFFDTSSLPAYCSITHGVNYTSQSGDYYYCDTATRYRKSENNLPTQNNKLTVNAGDLIAITITANESVILYGLETIYEFSSAAEDQIKAIAGEKKPKVQYDATVDSYDIERLNIYQPAGVGYIKFNFAHYVNGAKNADSWLVHPLTAVNDYLVNRFALTVTGEFECALQISGAPDFMGGSLHGSEVMDFLKVFIDGKEVAPSSITDVTEFETLRIIEQSKLYDPTDETTFAALHGKEYIFTRDKLQINQTIVWQVAETLGNSYLAMLPVAKTAVAKLITDNNYNITDLASSIPLNYTGPQAALSWKDSNGFSVRFSIPKWEINGSGIQGNDVYKATDNGGQNYFKQYFQCCSSGSVAQGEVWKTTTVYEFEINE